MRSAFYAISIISKGKSYVYKTIEGFDASHRMARSLSDRYKGKFSIGLRPLNRPNLVGAARLSAYRD